MKMLILDLETMPHEAWVWGLHDVHIAPSQIKRAGVIASFAAKWHGERKVIYADMREGEKAMLRKAHALLSEADAVIGWNSAPFDVKWLQGQFVKHGMGPCAPFKNIDLLRTMRSKFRIASNKLEYAAPYLGIGYKVQTGGFQMWKDCMAGDEKAWARMRRYNIADTVLTEKIYDKLLPWITNHPNVGLYDGTECCPKCGGDQFQRRGYQHSLTRRYARLQCRGCGSWLQSAISEPGTVKFKACA